MTEKQLNLKAEREGKKIRVLTGTDTVREGDYIEWATGAWTTIDKGSVYIGESPVIGHTVARLV